MPGGFTDRLGPSIEVARWIKTTRQNALHTRTHLMVNHNGVLYKQGYHLAATRQGAHHPPQVISQGYASMRMRA